MSLFESILSARGLVGEAKDSFLHPVYTEGHDPFLLPDMQAAVDRLVKARESQEHVMIYGDYDIDGLTATTVLLDAFDSFGFRSVEAFVPNRFVEGYGMTIEAVEKIAAAGATLIVTVDCGSLSEKEIVRAKELGIDVIVTDHHNVAPTQPPAVAVVNPKRLLQDHPEAYDGYVLKEDVAQLYPFLDLPGVGVAFKLVQALQTRLDGLSYGHEKWLLDLVALGTVCDVVTLVNENRMHVYWGLQVLAKTRRPGLHALMAVSGVEPQKVNARSLGFALGPRMNAAGRLETAQYALDMLRATDEVRALELASKLDDMNQARRAEQEVIYKEAAAQAEQFASDPVLVVSGKGWNHGIVGIVAAKLLEKYQKPTYVLEEMDAQASSEALAKGSARSFGDFSAADAIRAADDIITKGGGHTLAAGVTLPVQNIAAFRKRVNDYYAAQGLSPSDQARLLLPREDVLAKIDEVDEELLHRIATLEPFGQGNPQPILKSEKLLVKNVRRMGTEGQHVKLSLASGNKTMDFLAFSASEHFFVTPGQMVTIWYTPELNEWRGNRSVEGRILHLKAA